MGAIFIFGKRGRIAALILPILVALGLSSAPVLSARAQQILPIVTEDYPPYEMAVTDGALPGFDYEVATEAFRRMGYDPEISFLPWRRALAKVQEGSAVGVLTCAYTEERAGFIHYSNPISTFTSGLFVRTGYEGPVPKSLDDLKGRRVASVASYESLSELQALALDPIAAPTTITAVRMLLSERFDYLYVSKEATQFVVKELGVSDRVRFHPIVTKPFHFCFSRAYPGVEDLVVEFNRVLAGIRADGTYERVHGKYR